MSKESGLPNQYKEDYGYNQSSDTDVLKSNQEQHVTRIPTTDYGCFNQTTDNTDSTDKSQQYREYICVPKINNVRSLSLPVTKNRSTDDGRNKNVIINEPVSSSVVFIRPPNYMGLSIFTCFCCFWPLGLVAVIYAVGSSNASDNMDITKARNNGQIAKICCIASVVCGIIMYTVIGIVISHYAQIQDT